MKALCESFSNYELRVERKGEREGKEKFNFEVRNLRGEEKGE